MAAPREKRYYLNTVVDEIYRDIRTGTDDFFEPYREELIRYASTCDCLTNDIGAAYCYFTVRDKANVPIAFFSKTAQKKRAVSVCKYTQCFALPGGSQTYQNGFESLFRTGFFTEAQVDAYAAGDRSVIPGEGDDNLLRENSSPIGIHIDALRTILYKVMMRWLMGDSQLKIAVPAKERENYNQYVLRAVNEIYPYFPYAMRCEAGFSSYLLPNKLKEMKRVSLVFVPEEDADQNTIFLDGSTPSAYRKVLSSSSLMPAMKSFLDHLCLEHDLNSRNDFLNRIFQSIEGKNRSERDRSSETLAVSPMRYKEVGRAVAILDNQAREIEQIPEWIEFSHNGLKNLEEMEGLVWKKIENELTLDALATYTKNAMSSVTGIEAQLNVAENIYPVTEHSSDEIRSIPWQCLKEKLTQAEQYEEDIFSALDHYQERFKALAGNNEPSEIRETYARKCADKVIVSVEADIKSLRESKPELPDYRTRVERAIDLAGTKIEAFLSTHETDAKKRELYKSAYSYVVNIVSSRKERLDKDRINADVKDPEKLQKCSEDLEALKVLLEPCWAETDAYKKLVDDFSKTQSEIYQQMGSSGSRLKQFKKAVADANNYFAAIDLYYKDDKTYQVFLSDADKQRAVNEIQKLSPKTLEEYESAFSEYHSVTLDANSLRLIPETAIAQVDEDIKRLYEETPFAIAGNSLEEMLQNIQRIEERANNLVLGIKPKFYLYGTQLSNIELLKGVLRFSVESGSNEERVKYIVATLAQNRILTGRHIMRLLEMYDERGYDKGTLLPFVASGYFAKTDEDTYSRFFAEMIRTAEKKITPGQGNARLAAYNNVRSNVSNWNETARSTFDKLKPEEEKKAPARKEEYDDFSFDSPARANARENRAPRIEYIEKKSTGKTIAIVLLCIFLAGSIAVNALQLFGIIPSLKKDNRTTSEKIGSLVVTDMKNYLKEIDSNSANMEEVKAKLNEYIELIDNPILSSGVDESTRRAVKFVALFLNESEEIQKKVVESTTISSNSIEGRVSEVALIAAESIAEYAKEPLAVLNAGWDEESFTALYGIIEKLQAYQPYSNQIDLSDSIMDNLETYRTNMNEADAMEDRILAAGDNPAEMDTPEKVEELRATAFEALNEVSEEIYKILGENQHVSPTTNTEVPTETNSDNSDQ